MANPRPLLVAIKRMALAGVLSGSNLTSTASPGRRADIALVRETRGESTHFLDLPEMSSSATTE